MKKIVIIALLILLALAFFSTRAGEPNQLRFNSVGVSSVLSIDE